MTYFVSVSSYIPYQVSKDYTVQASNFGTAMSRAIPKYRLYLKERNGGKPKKLNEITVKVKRI